MSRHGAELVGLSQLVSEAVHEVQRGTADQKASDKYSTRMSRFYVNVGRNYMYI